MAYQLELSLVYDHRVKQMSFGAQSGSCDCFIFFVRSDWDFGSGPYVLAALIHVSYGSGWRHFQMFVNCLFSQAWPSYEMAILDSLQKSRFCWAEHSFVQVAN
jgi:hypothetical protein